MNKLSLLQISDNHLVSPPGRLLCEVDTQMTLERVLDSVLSQVVPQAVIATGDIAHDPEDATAYDRFHQTLRQRYEGPLACTPGNHDVSRLLDRSSLPCADLELGPWRIVLLDSHVDGQAASRVEDEQVASLEQRLDGAEYALVATHHHFFPVRCPWLDCDRIQSATLLEFLARHEAVRAVISGHVHQEAQMLHGDTWFFGAPSTCFQFEPGTSKPTLNSLPPGWRLLELYHDGRVVSNVGRVNGLTLNPVFPGQIETD